MSEVLVNILETMFFLLGCVLVTLSYMLNGIREGVIYYYQMHGRDKDENPPVTMPDKLKRFAYKQEGNNFTGLHYLANICWSTLFGGLFFFVLAFIFKIHLKWYILWELVSKIAYSLLLIFTCFYAVNSERQQYINAGTKTEEEPYSEWFFGIRKPSLTGKAEKRVGNIAKTALVIEIVFIFIVKYHI